MAHITPAFLKKHPNFTLPKVGMDFTIGMLGTLQRLTLTAKASRLWNIGQ